MRLIFHIHISSAVDHEIKALFIALVVYRIRYDLHLERGPSSTLLGPPPSPTRDEECQVCSDVA